MEFYGGEDWRKNEGAGMKRCIQPLVGEELVEEYPRDSEPDKETRGPLKEKVGAKWREDQGVAGRSYILGIIKAERKKIREETKTEERNLEGENTKEEEGNQESEKDKRRKKKSRKRKHKGRGKKSRK